MILKSILSLAYAVALSGYGAFVNGMDVSKFEKPVLLSEADATTVKETGTQRRLVRAFLQEVNANSIVSEAYSYDVAWGSIGLSLRRRGSICQWTEVPMFSWCNGHGAVSETNRHKKDEGAVT